MENKGQIIKKYRKEKKYTQQQLSEILEISSNHLSLIENNKKGISKKLADKLCKIFDFSKEDKEILYSNLQKRYMSKEAMTSFLKKQKELEERELELVNTYDFIRENHLALSKRAAVNNLLIDYFSETEKLVTTLELKLVDENEEFIKKVTPALKTTIKKVGKKMEEMAKIMDSSSIINIEDEGVKVMIDPNLETINNLLQLIPKDKMMKILTHEQKRMAILTYVAQNLKIKWKEYNIPGCASGFSLRLWEAGRGKDPKKKGYMQNKVSKHIDLQLEGATSEEELEELLEDIVYNIIDHSMIIVEASLKAARHAKTPSVRRKYLKSISDKSFLLAALQIGVILYSSELLSRGIDINHEYLKLRLEGMKENKNQLQKAWKEFKQSEQTEEDYQRLVDITNEVLKEFEEKREMNEKQLDKIVQEKMILTIIGEKNIEKYIYGMMDNMAQSITGKIRLIPVEEF